MKHVGLFEGIGGFSLAAEWMGWETISWCEINEFCQKVLKYHFPKAIGHGDIKTTDFTIYRGLCDILTGGFPCQPFSVAGKQKGTEDDRYLWEEMLRAIREIQPSWIVGENVSGIVNWSKGVVFDKLQSDLEIEGYEILPILLPACSINAPHKRERCWFIAHSSSNGFKGRNKELQTQPKQRHDAQDSVTELWQGYSWKHDKLPTPAITRTDDGLPDRMDRIKALGNAIVPQVAYQIFKTIEQYENIING